MRRWLRIPLDRPIITPVLLTILVAIYIPMALSPQLNEQLLNWGANVRFLVLRGEWWRLITSTFLHGPIIHIASNGYALYVIGMEAKVRLT